MDRLERIRALLLQNPDDDLLWFTLGREEGKTGRFGEAAAAFERAVRLKPDYATALREWGQALVQLGRTDEARQIFDRAIEAAVRSGDFQVEKEAKILLSRLS
jgi:Flp pilus assembly protein TadD